MLRIHNSAELMKSFFKFWFEIFSKNINKFIVIKEEEATETRSGEGGRGKIITHR